jgi:hypothetical protein
MFPIASSNTRGTGFFEGVISGALLTVALALFTLCGIVLKRVTDAATKRNHW